MDDTEGFRRATTFPATRDGDRFTGLFFDTADDFQARCLLYVTYGLPRWS
jgi:hypothetical protein